MKKIFLFCLIINGCTKALAQKDYSGSYGFSFKVAKELDPPKSEKDGGRTGNLTLFKINSLQYKFWLDVNNGYPSYNMGNANGIISIKNNKAVYKTKLDYADSACEIFFTFYNNFIKIEQSSSNNDCGYGAGVYGDGKYLKKNSHKLKNADLEDQYTDYAKFKIIIDKSFLFDDKEGIKKKKQYFIKNDIVLSTTETDKFVYVEYITDSRKFIYGWLKKSDIKEFK